MAEHRELPGVNTPEYGAMQRIKSLERYGKRHEKFGEKIRISPTTLNRAINIMDEWGETYTSDVATKLRGTEALNAEFGKKQDDISHLSEHEQGEIIAQSEARLETYATKARHLDSAINTLTRERNETALQIQSKKNEQNAYLIQWQDETQSRLNNLTRIRKDRLPFISPEAFIADNLITLRRFKRAYDQTGIVPTESVREKRIRIKEKLAETNYTVLIGETGTGKTQEAKSVAVELFKKNHPDSSATEPEQMYKFIAGHKYMRREDLFGYVGIKASHVKPEELPGLIDEAKVSIRAKLEAEGRAESEIQSWEDRAETLKFEQSTRSTMMTEDIEGVVKQARREGKIVVFDEFNFVEPGLIAGLYEQMQDKNAAPGFGIIFTGNLSKADIARYSRQTMDTAFANRIGASLIEYNTPPQGDLEAVNVDLVSNEERKAGKRTTERELYQIALTQLVDDKGNLYAPEGALDEVWRMTQAFKLFQNVFAGENIGQKGEYHGVNIELKKTHASMRTLNSIISKWKSDGFTNSLDYYMYEYLIRPAAIIAPREAGYYRHILKDIYGFFPDSKDGQPTAWADRFDEDAHTGNLMIKGEIRKADFQNYPDLRLFNAQEVAEAFSGYQMPTEVQDIGQGKDSTRLSPEEIKEKGREMQMKIKEVETKLKGFRESLKFFCMDEKEIRGADNQAIIDTLN